VKEESREVGALKKFGIRLGYLNGVSVERESREMSPESKLRVFLDSGDATENLAKSKDSGMNCAGGKEGKGVGNHLSRGRHSFLRVGGGKEKATHRGSDEAGG